jgi:hypothetical protein
MRKLAQSYQRLMSSILDIRSRRSVHRGHAEAVSLSKMEYTELGLAEPGHVGEQRLESRLQLAGGSRDDGEKFRRRAPIRGLRALLTNACIEWLRVSCRTTAAPYRRERIGALPRSFKLSAFSAASFHADPRWGGTNFNPPRHMSSFVV